MSKIARASDAFDAGGKRYAEGSYIIRMQQPYSSYAKTLLERQHYPDIRLVSAAVRRSGRTTSPHRPCRC